VQLSRTGTPLGFLDIDSLPVQLIRTPNDAKSIVDITTGQKPDRDPTPEGQGKDPAAAELGASSHLPSSR
jgi:hypothetical protein